MSLFGIFELRLTVSDENRLTLFVIQVVATDAPSVHLAVIPDTAN